MHRRKFIVTLGTLAVGSGAAMGSGAFTSVSAERSTNISVVEDENAFLAIDSCDGPNGEYMVKHDDGTWGLYLNGESSPPGQGLNPNSHYRIKNIFKIENQGTQPVAVWLDPPKPSDGERTFNWANQNTGDSQSGGEGSGGGDCDDGDCDDGCDSDDGDCDDGGDCDEGECDGGDGHSGGSQGGSSHGKNKFAPGRDFKFLNENGGGSNTGNTRGHEEGDPVRCATELDVDKKVIIGLDITVPGDEIGHRLDDERTIYASANPPYWVTHYPPSPNTS